MRSRHLPGLTALVWVAFALVPRAAAADPLDYVPTDAAVFAHVRIGDVWNSPLAKEIREAAGKYVDQLLGELRADGIPIENLDTATFFYPTMPQGSGDEKLFVVVGVATRPLDRDKLLLRLRKKDAKIQNGRVELDDKFILHFADDRTFVVAHESQIEKFAMAPAPNRKPGVMSDALKLARERHHFVLSVDFSKLPDEILTAAPQEFQPFLPLLKSKSSVFLADLKDKELRLAMHFTCATQEGVQEAERSFKLLMKLATDGLIEVLADEKVVKDLGPATVLLKTIKRGVENATVNRVGSQLETSVVFKADFPIAETVKEVVKKLEAAASSAEAANNLRQIGLANHGYSTAFRELPPAAICDKKGKPLLSWRVAILPYLDQDELYKQFKLDEPWDSEHNKKLIPKMPKIYLTPGTQHVGKTHYRVFTGNGAVFDMVQSERLERIPDGTSNTLMIVESAEAVEWTKPEDFEFDPKKPITPLIRFKDDRTPVLFCDGSVRFVNKKVADKVWAWLIDKQDGNPIPDLDE